MSQVQLEQLGKRFADSAENVVSNINLMVNSGELVALLGSSGCGKTTTLRMIAGLIQPTTGDIRLDGQSILSLPPEKRNIGMVFQKPLLFGHMTVFENISFGLRMQRQTAQFKFRVAQMLELVRLPGFEARRPGQLSGGQEQRVALARALITKPKLLLDEPFSALDAHLRTEMRDLIMTCQRDLGTTMIFVTHDQEEAVILANRIAFMSNGTVHQFDTPKKFFEYPRDQVVARFFGGLNFITGIGRNGLLETPLGLLKVARVVPDGAARVTIRPEAMRIVPTSGANTVQARVIAQTYLGTHKRYRCIANGLELQINVSPSSSYGVGDDVFLYLHPENLWLLES